jgi:hypothetical protein
MADTMNDIPKLDSALSLALSSLIHYIRDIVVHLQRRPELNGLSIRSNVVKVAGFKHALNAARAYTYYFTWQTPIPDNLPVAWHIAELQFCFDNASTANKALATCLKHRRWRRRWRHRGSRLLQPAIEVCLNSTGSPPIRREIGRRFGTTSAAWWMT